MFLFSSKDISEMLKLLFKVNPKDRPSCGEILKHPLVQKRLEFFRAQAGSENVDFDDKGKKINQEVKENQLFLEIMKMKV